MRIEQLHLLAFGPFDGAKLDLSSLDLSGGEHDFSGSKQGLSGSEQGLSGSEQGLSGSKQGLHIIYGPNEAGKSSAMRAIGHFFFGFPSRTEDNWLHPYGQLRIGARLRQQDGTILECVRRKAQKSSLRDGQDNSPVEEELLQRMLGGIDRDQFQIMFGIDHRRLRQAGEDIARGEGRIGELLFAAGAGLAGLEQVR